ncbi:DUF1499 domain-containing protein [Hoeflea olei]|uniref:DUF1499 domain-containing protein n=1 Tax=Hoeflea olei TaxID=1480615 RepID=A0A1C1YQ56_9HYPH|nr:DUF1499 domain-containing protein [Hoeflea olei]OCW55648.1 hypothetical protein AWJ14_06600 [Hoeflea olei]
MPFRPQRPSSVAAAWSRRLGRFALLLAVMAVALHRAGILVLPNAVAAVLLAAFLAVVVLGLSLIGFFMLWRIGAKGGHAAFSGMVLALMVLVPVGLAASRYVLLPAIHDVSTDLANAPQWLNEPPVKASWLPRADGDTASARAEQAAAYPQVTGRRYDGAIDRVLQGVRAVAQERKWKQVDNIGVDLLVDGLEPASDAGEAAVQSTGVADPARAPIPVPRPDIENAAPEPVPTYALIQYEKSTLILGIPQDILIRLVEEEATTFVDMRVATRDGNHDLGLNAELIRSFLRDLDIRLLGIAGS